MKKWLTLLIASWLVLPLYASTLGEDQSAEECYKIDQSARFSSNVGSYEEGSVRAGSSDENTATR
jgi:hypothetical protein